MNSVKKYVSAKWERLIMVVFGNVLLSMGISVFKLSGMGNDPFSGMVMSLADVTGISYGSLVVIVNIVFFTIQFIAGRSFIGPGTIFNMLLQGYIASFFYDIWLSTVGLPTELWQQVCIVSLAVVINSFGVSFYQGADVGAAPYDAMSLIMAKKWKKIPYFWHRISNDAVCTIICFVSGGIIGLGTLLATFCLGPFIHLVNHHLTFPLLARIDERKAKK